MSWEGTVRGDSLTSEVAWTNIIATEKRYNTQSKQKKRSDVDIVSRYSEALSG